MWLQLFWGCATTSAFFVLDTVSFTPLLGQPPDRLATPQETFTMPAQQMTCRVCQHTFAATAADSAGQTMCPSCGLLIALRPAATETKWYYSHNRRKLGPVSLGELRRLVEECQIQPSDMVLQVGTSKWNAAAGVERLFPPVTGSGTAAGPGTGSPSAEGKRTSPGTPTSPLPELLTDATTPFARAAQADAPSPAQPSPNAGPLPADQAPPPVVASIAATSTTAPAASDHKPWNPLVLFLAGVLFGIPWLGTMLALNARQLRMAGLPWRALVFAVGGLCFALASLAFNLVPADTLPPTLATLLGVAFFLAWLCLSVGSLALLWWFDVRPQRVAYSTWSTSGLPRGSWLLPVLAGVAWTIAVFALNSWLHTLSGREVCQRFAAAYDGREEAIMLKYSNPRLHHAIEAIPTLEGDAKGSHFMSLGEGHWEDGLFVVRFHRVYRFRGRHEVHEGAFVMERNGRSWRIQEMYQFPVENGQVITEEFSVAYPIMEDAIKNAKKELRGQDSPKSGESRPSQSVGKTTDANAQGSFFNKLGNPEIWKLIAAVVSFTMTAVGALGGLWRRYAQRGPARGVQGPGVVPAGPAKAT
jgi:hypothetical protein